MSRALLILNGQAERERAIDWIQRAPAGSRIEFKGPRRSTDQNSKLWACLTDVAMQVRWGWEGEKLSTDDWKSIFLHALKRELRTAPDLDRKGVVPLGRSSSDLSKEEFSNLLELILAFGAKNGVTFHDPQGSTS